MNPPVSLLQSSGPQTANSHKALLEALRGFQPKYQIKLEFGDMEITTAQNSGEVEEALRLRYEIFFKELNLTSIADLDVDNFDLVADHLLLRDCKSNKVVGTYRLLSSTHVEEFYSETEFDLSSIRVLPGIKLELGRAGIHPDYRNSSAIQMLWKGLTAYFTACKARYMFGCSSVDAHRTSDFGLLHAWLEKNHMTDEICRVKPRNGEVPLWLSLDTPQNMRPEEWERRAERLAPALLKAYIRAGAKVCGMPAWDPVFNTLDYFTLFDLSNLNASYGRKFGVSADTV